MGFIPERLLMMMMMMIYLYTSRLYVTHLSARLMLSFLHNWRGDGVNNRSRSSSRPRGSKLPSWDTIVSEPLAATPGVVRYAAVVVSCRGGGGSGM